MIRVDLAWVAAAVEGQLVGENLTIEDVSTDTRNLPAGSLFIALQGPNFNAHEFVPQAIAKGAAAAIVEQQQDCDCPQIIVKDTRYALGLLGAAVKQQVAPKTIAITGSSGKTTVKEMMAAILGRRGKVLATAGNFNNDIGVPLTLLRLTQEHDYGVLELGANHRGEIAYTSGLVKPNVAIINNVSPAHVEGFGDVHGIAKAKSEIFRGLQEGGLAITPQDSEFAGCWQRVLADVRHQTFGSGDAAVVQAHNIALDNAGCATFEISLPSKAGSTDRQNAKIHVPIPGQHNVHNALVAAAACLELGCTLADVAAGLQHLEAVPGRLQSHDIATDVRLIDDTYNANVGSTKAALDLLASYSGYRIMVLGDMGELGEDARAYHEEIGAYGIKVGIDNLFTLGVLSQSASDVFNGHGGRHFGSLDLLVSHILNLIESQRRPVTILVKGSRSAHMERVVLALRQRADEIGQSEGQQAC